MRADCVRRLCGAVLAAFLCGGVPSSVLAQEIGAQNPSPADEAPLVTEVRIVSEDGHVLNASTSAIAVEVGKPLDREKVAASLKALYRTGVYSDIRALSEHVEGGIRVDFVVRENLFFNQVIVAGLKPPPSEASAAAAMQITLGDAFRKQTLDEALDRLKARLQEEGFYTAKMNTELRPHPAEHQMDVVVSIDPGARVRVGVIHLTNNTEYLDSEIASRFKLKAGKEITSVKIQNGTSRIRKFLVKKGHLSGRAAVRRGTYDSAKNTVDLTLDVSEGARVKVEVAGAKFSKGDLKKLIPIYQEGAVDPDLLEEGKRNIRERLEREGYFDASVEYASAMREVQTKSWKGQEQVITYTIERGDRHKLIGIEITGNHYFDKELLSGRLQIYKAAFGSRGTFSRRILEGDRQSMENLYRANGFPAATVAAQVEDNYGKKQGDLLIRFVVSEGVQTRVADLKIEGNHAFEKEELLAVIASLPGQPYSDFNVSTDRANILARYFNEGFPEATFESHSEPVEEQAAAANSNPVGKLQDKTSESRAEKKTAPVAKNAVRLIYIIHEGQQVHTRHVLITGYDHTRQGVIRREVQVKPAAPLREGQVVDSQRRLYNLGVFNRVTIAPQNLTGRADSLSLKLRGSTLQGRALLGYSVPNTFGNSHLSSQATAFVEKTQDINTFTESRYEGSIQLTDHFSTRTTLLYRYSFRKVLVSNLNIPPEEIPLFQQPTLVSQFSTTWVRDTRNNPADATRGWLNSADFGIADTYVGSSASFIRFLYQNSSYHPIKRRFSFARSFRIGVLAPYRDTVSLTFPAQTQEPLPQLIPLPERFFAGGGTSLRGFALNQAGPRDSQTGFPVGGQAMLVFNQEFRFPLRLPYLGNRLGGTLFYDGGNVYSTVNRITLRWTSPKPIFDPANPKQCLFNCTNELNYFSHTVGVGVRYSTPVGPIRVDLGYQMNRPPFVIPIPCPSGSTTATCTTGSLGFQSTQLPRLQVFFSLGSSF